MIVDAHTHWGIVWAERHKSDPTAFVDVMDRHNVDYVALMGHRGLTSNCNIVHENNIIAAISTRYLKRLIPIATVHPAFGEESLQEFERCIQIHDMRGLKLHPWLQGFSLADPIVDALAEMCGKYNVPMIFHDGTPCYSMPSQIAGLALRFPDTKFVLGHAGLLELWRSALSFANLCPNIYITLCGPHYAAMKELVNTVDEHRILWGSDFGFGWSDSIRYRKGLIDQLDIPDTLRARILGLNACDLFGIVA